MHTWRSVVHSRRSASFVNGALLYARDMDWGYGDSAIGEAESLNRQKLARRLATELRHSFLYLKQYWDDDVSQVVLSGDMPEIRSLTAPLIEFLNIEVETLDTLEGIDASSIPEGFAEQAATFRLATSISADPPPINLLPYGNEICAKTTRGELARRWGSSGSDCIGVRLQGFRIFFV